MNILCFDISTGGLSAALFDLDLNPANFVEVAWDIALKSDGSAVLDPGLFQRTLVEVARKVNAGDARNRIDAISFSAFMHSCVLLEGNDPTGPIFTWLDRRGSPGVDTLRKKLGTRFHELTGCRFHPMFPVFKLASLNVTKGVRVASAKSLAVARLTGEWVEDHGMASATGLYDLRQGTWSGEILDAVALPQNALLRLIEPDAIVGKVTSEAASRLGLRPGTPVVAGSGDGILAHIGSGCDRPSRMSATLGTSSSARQQLSRPVLDESAGTFCYRTVGGAFLLGCASSNGGNVLEWARSIFGELPSQSSDRTDLPTFIPLLNGERSPDWNETLTASWQGVKSSHTAADLHSAVLEGVVFNLAHYAEILARTSAELPCEIVLSGNGFRNPVTSEILSAAVDARVLTPATQGFASLRGAAICGFQALGIEIRPALDRIVAEAELIGRNNHSAAIRQRYARYRESRTM